MLWERNNNLLKIAVIIMGFSGFVGQMLLLRELLIIFSGNELSIGVIFANWVILEAFGSSFFGKKAEKTKRAIEHYCVTTIIFCLSLPLAVYLTRISKVILGVSIGESFGFAQIIYLSFFILMPTSISHGALFPFSCKLCSIAWGEKASSVGKVYIYETIGTILGGIVWTYLLITYLHSFQIATILGFLNLCVVIILLFSFWENGALNKIIIFVSIVFLALFSYGLFLNGANQLHKSSLKTQWKSLDVVHYQNSLYGNICVVKNEEQYIFFSDGVPELIVPVPDIEFVEKFVHIPLLSHPNPKKLFILSGGVGGVINECLKHPYIEKIEYAEIDPLFLKLIKQFSTSLTEYELNHNKVKVDHTDGRLFLKLTKETYDIIFVGILNPSDLQTNRLFTKEFFTLAKNRLDQGGILVIGLPGTFRYLSNEYKKLNSSIYHTLKSVFPNVRVFPGEGTNLYLASDSKEVFLLDKISIMKRIEERRIQVDAPVARHIREALHPGWQDWFSKIFGEENKKVNFDFKPIGVFFSVSHWNSVFAPRLSKVFDMLEKINLNMIFLVSSLLMIVLIILIYKGIYFNQLVIPSCIFTTGFAGMIFNLLLIFAFQAIYGYVFFWISLITSFFMVGMSCGAIFTTYFLSQIKDRLGFFIKIDFAILFFSIILPYIFVNLHPHVDNPFEFNLLKGTILLMSFVGGTLVGAEFPLANEIYLVNTKNVTHSAWILYSSDLLGGWFSGIIGGVVLLPVLGLQNTGITVALVKLITFTLMMASILITHRLNKR